MSGGTFSDACCYCRHSDGGHIRIAPKFLEQVYNVNGKPVLFRLRICVLCATVRLFFPQWDHACKARAMELSIIKLKETYGDPDL